MSRLKRNGSIVLLVALIFLAAPTQADAPAGWSIGISCPKAGTSGTGSATFSHNSGFSASATCRRMGTFLTRVEINSFSGDTPQSTTVDVVQVGDLAVMKPILPGEDQPNYLTETARPDASREVNWITVQWLDSESRLHDTYLLGKADVDPSGQVSITGQWDIDGTPFFGNSVPMPGSWGVGADEGVYTAVGGVDPNLEGVAYFNRNSSGVFKTNPGKATFFFPISILDMSNYGGLSYSGIVFDSSSATSVDDIRLLRVVSNGTGTLFQAEPYSDPETGSIATGGDYYRDEISVLSFNDPEDGMFLGRVERFDAGDASLGTGLIGCIANSHEVHGYRVICSGENPTNNTLPFNITFSAPSSTTITATASGVDTGNVVNDCSDYGGSQWSTSGAMHVDNLVGCGGDAQGFIRFTNLAIPPGATILGATLTLDEQVAGYASSSGTNTNLYLSVVDSFVTPMPTNASGANTEKNNTAASVGYVDAGTGIATVEYDITPLIQNRVRQSGTWSQSGNATIFTIRATNGQRNYGDSVDISVSYVVPVSAPTAPFNLEVSAVSGAELDITWKDASAAEYGFELERSLDGSTGWTQVAYTYGGTESFRDTGLSGNTVYYYRLRAVNDAGNSAWTEVANGSTLSVFTASGADSGAAINDCSDYGGDQWTTSGTTFVDSLVGCSGDAAAFYRFNPMNIPANATITSATLTLTESTTGYSSSAGSNVTLTLSAHNSTNAAMPANFTAATTLRGQVAASVSYVDAAPSNGAVDYDVTALVQNRVLDGAWSPPSSGLLLILTMAGGQRSYGDSASLSVEYSVPSSAPAAPSSLTLSVGGGDSIDLSWTDNSSDETLFEVERSPDGSSSWSSVGSVFANLTAFTDSGLSGNTTYYYRVRATNGAGNSSYSNVASTTTDKVWFSSGVNTGYSMGQCSDDGGNEWSTSGSNRADPSTGCGGNAVAIYRFPGVRIPASTTISSATLTLEEGAGSSSVTVTVSVHDSVNQAMPSNYSTANTMESQLALGVSSVDAAANSGATVLDVGSLIQNRVNAVGWDADSNAIILMISVSAGYRMYGDAATLTVTY